MSFNLYPLGRAPLVPHIGAFQRPYPFVGGPGLPLQGAYCNHGGCSHTQHGHINMCSCQRGNNGCAHGHGGCNHRGRDSNCSPFSRPRSRSRSRSRSRDRGCDRGCNRHDRHDRHSCDRRISSRNEYTLPVSFESRSGGCCDSRHGDRFDVKFDTTESTRDIEDRIARMKGLRSGDIDVCMIFHGGAEYKLSQVASVSDLVAYIRSGQVQALRVAEL